jgi:hypothetical protein
MQSAKRIAQACAVVLFVAWVLALSAATIAELIP